MKHWLHTLTVAIAGAALACSGRDAADTRPTGGALIIATGQDADAVFPPLVQSGTGQQVGDMLFLRLATFSDRGSLIGDGDFAPAIADRWRWASDSLSIEFHIDARAKWHDGVPITPEDAVFSLALFRHPQLSPVPTPHFAHVDSITVTDSSSFTAWFGGRSGSQFFEFVFNFIPLPAHVYREIGVDSLARSAAAMAPVGSGRFRFAQWDAGQRVEVVADTVHWLGRPSLDRIMWTVSPDPIASIARLAAGEADLMEVVRGDAVSIARTAGNLQLITRPSLDFALALFNTRDQINSSVRHPVFGDPATRRALAMGIDVPTLVSNVLDSLGHAMTSPYHSAQGVTGITLTPYNVNAAKQLLDSLGWREIGGSDIRVRRGQRLAFSVAAPSTSAPRVRASTIMQNAWKQLGADVTLIHTDPATLNEMGSRGKFDIALLGFSGDPSPAALRQRWRSSGDAGNWGRYANSRFDQLIDSAAFASSGQVAMDLYREAGQILADDAPAIWLYEARALTAVNHRFKVGPMPAYGWWAHLADWSVDPAMAIDRDRIGIGTRRD